MNAMSPKVMTAFSLHSHFLKSQACHHGLDASVGVQPSPPQKLENLPEAWMKQPEKKLYRITNKLYFTKESSMRRILPAFGSPGTLGRMKAITIGSSAAMDCRTLPLVDYCLKTTR